jgi:hypothetical protein
MFIYSDYHAMSCCVVLEEAQLPAFLDFVGLLPVAFVFASFLLGPVESSGLNKGLILALTFRFRIIHCFSLEGAS